MGLVLRFTENKRRLLLYALLYFVLTVVALAIESVWFSNTYFKGRWITNSMTVLYFILMYAVADTYLRKLMLGMVGLSFIGEIIFSILLEMYVYTNIRIPVYVPFGHAVLYATGYTLANTNFVIKNTAVLTKWFNVFFAVLFIGVTVFWQDYFSFISGILFFLLLKRKKWDLKYSCIAFCVIYIEIIGTAFGCWTWTLKIFGILPTINPPVGAIFYYAGGDVLLAKLVNKYWKTSV